jgi:hypothetical protein
MLIKIMRINLTLILEPSAPGCWPDILVEPQLNDAKWFHLEPGSAA